ncbi:hypothetical protein CEXT_470801 [Caerostris extrusa]|uniref:Uncharacterized protein n=1 Tax=Caerostris extrusa TaxID=172846 RepID=A0AAV4WWX2_CAEEX|nr:hypothetical protein CEXT_470801 [Caerostris extrusa]
MFRSLRENALVERGLALAVAGDWNKLKGRYPEKPKENDYGVSSQRFKSALNRYRYISLIAKGEARFYRIDRDGCRNLSPLRTSYNYAGTISCEQDPPKTTPFPSEMSMKRHKSTSWYKSEFEYVDVLYTKKGVVVKTENGTFCSKSHYESSFEIVSQGFSDKELQEWSKTDRGSECSEGS